MRKKLKSKEERCDEQINRIKLVHMNMQNESAISDVAKLRPEGRLRPAKDFLRPLKKNFNDKQPNLWT